MKYLMKSKSFTESKTYIKTYEGKSAFKKYVIYTQENWDNNFWLLKVSDKGTQKKESIIFYDRWYHYYSEDELKTAAQTGQHYSLNNGTIVYQTDDLDDGLKELRNFSKVKWNTNKYNL